MGSGELVKGLSLAKLSIGARWKLHGCSFAVVLVQMLFEGSWMNVGVMFCSFVVPHWRLARYGTRLGC
jgi:hypothetical protein